MTAPRYAHPSLDLPRAPLPERPTPDEAIDRGWGSESVRAIVRCAHPLCRTSLAEDDAVQCPHGFTFCQHCAWEEACSECAA